MVAEIVGHGNPAMTRHYSHISTDTKKKAIEALPALTIDAVPVPVAPAPGMLDEKRQQLLAAIAGADERTLDELLQKAKPKR